MSVEEQQIEPAEEQGMEQQGDPGANGKTPGNPNSDVDLDESEEEDFFDEDGPDEVDDLQEGISNLESLISTARANGFSDDDIKEEMEQLNKLKAQLKSSSKPSSSKKPDEEEEEEDGADPPQKKSKAKKPEADADEDDEDPFGVGLKSKKKADDKVVEIKDWDDFAKNAKSLGASDPSKLFASAKTWRADSQKLSKVEKELTTLSTALENLPIPVKAAVTAAIEGKDYVKEFNANASSIDFLSTFEKNDGEKVARHFFKNRFEKLDKKLEDGVIEQSDYDEEKSDLIDLAKDKFETKAESVRAARDKIQKDADAKAKAFSDSLGVTVAKLTEKFPSMSKKAIAQTQSILESEDGVASLLYDENGALKPEAATLVAYMLNGEKLLSAAIKAAAKKGASNARQEVVQRGSERVEKSSASSGMGGKKSEEQQLLDTMSDNAIDPSEIYRSK